MYSTCLFCHRPLGANESVEHFPVGRRLAFDAAKEDDHRFENQGVAVVVDKTSMQFVFGSEVDWVDGLQGAGFSVNNPNVVAACGCGSSFQVKEDAAEQAAAV